MIRKIIDNFSDYYGFKIIKYEPVTSKTYKVFCNEGKCYFLKKCDLLTGNKYDFLKGQGVGNVIYPIKTINSRFSIRSKLDSFYLTPYLNTNNIKNEIKVQNFLNELNSLHINTSYKEQLSPKKSRRKMESIYEYLEYKFNLIEIFVRTIESRPFDENSILILKNYHILLDIKKDMAKLQKKIISSIKSKISVDMAFIHNNPKLDHLLVCDGSCYLSSLDNSKIGLPILDIVKLYIENEDINIDYSSLIKEYLTRYTDLFYYDYFCFMVMLYYIKGLIIIDKDYVTSQSFIFTTSSLNKFRQYFLLNS